MARKTLNAVEFFGLVKKAAELEKDCVWVSEEMQKRGCNTKPNSVYQRINGMNLKLEQEGKTGRVPVLKQDSTTSKGVGGKKLNLDSIAGMFE